MTSTSTTTIELADTTASTEAAESIETGDISGFDVDRIRIGGEELLVAIADTPSLRGRGLMEVTDLGDLDGMLFTWGGEVVQARFTMANTLIPLRIAFFGADGALVDTFVMEPCTGAGLCDPYPAAAAYAYALELPADRTVDPGSRLELQP